MTRSRRLRPIVELAGHREKEASRVMADSETRLATHTALLEDLQRYHSDYTHSTIMRNADAVRLQDYRLFLDRLEQAIVRQLQLIARLESECAEHRQTWTSHRSHRKALDNAASRYARAENLAADKEEQRQIDEISSLLRRHPG